MNLQIFAALVGVGLSLYVISKYLKNNFRKLDLFLTLPFSLTLIVVALYPPIQESLAKFFSLQNRLFATIVISIIMLYLLFLIILNQISSNRKTIGDLIRSLATREYLEGVSDSKLDVLIVIPAYNEEKNILSVIKKIPKKIKKQKIGIVVVEDGGSDNTVAVVRSVNVPITSHVINRGQGDSLRTGFDIALRVGAKVVVNMDADGQHKPEDLDKIIKPILDDKADFVKGSRFLGSHEGTSKSREIGINLFSGLLTILLPGKITDATNGYRAIRVSELSRLELTERRFSAPEILIEAYKNNLRVLEVPVKVKARSSGKSKKPSITYPIGFLFTILRTWLR